MLLLVGNRYALDNNLIRSQLLSVSCYTQEHCNSFIQDQDVVDSVAVCTPNSPGVHVGTKL